MTLLFHYTHWANERVRQALLQGDWPEANRLFSHLLQAHAIWLNRIEGKFPQVDPWEPLLPNAWEALDRENYERSLHLLSSLDPDRLIEYTNTQGQAYRTKVSDIFLHVANHGAHHRGQIMLLIRQSGVAPPATDYIVWVRQ